jgi:NMT1-like family
MKSVGRYESQVASTVQEFTQRLLMPMLRFVVKWIRWALPFLFYLVVFFLIWDYFDHWRVKPIEFLIGPRGGDSADQSKVLQRHFDDEPYIWQRKFFITPIYTDGFVENYERVNSDADGTRVGYAMDGMPDAADSNVETILPMEWEYMHFIYRIDALKRLGVLETPIAGDQEGNKGKGAEPVLAYQLSEWAKSARARIDDATCKDLLVLSAPGTYLRLQSDGESEAGVRFGVKWLGTGETNRELPRVYLGPPKSGTRSVAEAILRHVNISPDDIDAVEIGDFQDMFVALRQKRIDGGFYMGPRGAATVKRIARELPCVLVNINGAGQIANTYRSVEAASIPTGMYNFKHESEPKRLSTLAARRVLIASKWMDANVAFRIANNVQESLPHRVPKKNADGTYPAPDEDLESIALNYVPHPGMWSEDNPTGPAKWFDRHADWFVPFMLTSLVVFLTAFRDPIVTWFERHGPPGEPKEAEHSSKQRAANAAEIDLEIKRILKGLHDFGDDLAVSNQRATDDELQEWQRQIAKVCQTIAVAKESKSLSDDELVDLKGRAYDLREQFDVLERPWAEEPIIRGNSGRAGNPAGKRGRKRGGIRPKQK